MLEVVLIGEKRSIPQKDFMPAIVVGLKRGFGKRAAGNGFTEFVSYRLNVHHAPPTKDCADKSVCFH
jgi:hypothetical protein